MDNYDDIQAQFNEVIEFSQGIKNPKTDVLFADWWKNKQYFIELFNGQLIYEVPYKVQLTLNAEDSKQLIDDFIDYVEKGFNNLDLANFIWTNGVTGFLENKVLYPYCDIEKGIDIKTGSKLIKAFKHFEKDKKALNLIQSKASQITQKNEVEGTLCFSVHPLDYLSSSENNYNWSTCHSLRGVYRSGNLSYMADDSTILCYLKGEDNVKIPMFPNNVKWNSKKWRMLLHFSQNKNLVFAGRQYPINSKSPYEEILKAFRALGKCKSGWKRTYNIIKDDLYISFCGGQSQPLKDIIQDAKNSCHFNDLLNSPVYTMPYYIDNFNGTFEETPTVLLGHEVKCLHCEDETITNPETMRCNECEIMYGNEENESYGFCACCGTRINKDETLTIGSDYICDNCCKTECFICEDCGNLCYNEEMCYDPKDQMIKCAYCADKEN